MWRARLRRLHARLSLRTHRIFSRFERLEHPGRPAPAGGSGIGLTIARGIARAHGGDVTASSPGPGHGATFTLRIPTAPR